MVPFIEHLLNIVLPRACIHCLEDLPAGQSAALCLECENSLIHTAKIACIRCADQLVFKRNFCHQCVGRLFACRLIRAASTYEGASKSLVHHFKFNHLPSAAKTAGRLMAAQFEKFPELSSVEALVPVPLNNTRLRQRGYNQAELLAREIACVTGRPVIQALVRQDNIGPSWKLNRAQRKEQLAGVFNASANYESEIKGLKVLLIDDVCSSGITLEECAFALRKAQVKDVLGYVFARAFT